MCEFVHMSSAITNPRVPTLEFYFALTFAGAFTFYIVSASPAAALPESANSLCITNLKSISFGVATGVTLWVHHRLS